MTPPAPRPAPVQRFVENEIEERRLDAERRRTALEPDGEIAALGRDNVAMIRIIRDISASGG